MNRNTVPESRKRATCARRVLALCTFLTLVLLLVASVTPGASALVGEHNPKITDALKTAAPLDPELGMGLLPAAPGDYPTLGPPGDAPLSASVDLSGQLPPVGNQGRQGSCVAWATSYYYKSWSEKQEHTAWSLSNQYYQFSPSFMYNQINGGQDGGAYFQDAFDLLQTNGDVDIADMPYDQTNYTRQPTATQHEAAKPYRIPSGWSSFWNQQYMGPYNPPNNITTAKNWLTSGKLLVIGTPIYNDFPDYGNPSKTYYDYNGTSGLAGGHGMCVVGYNDDINPGGEDADHRGGFKIVNSWGASWNGTNRGYVYFSYDFMKRYVWEAWTMSDLGPDSPTLNSLSSNSGNIGATIAFNGSNFGALRRNAKVTFNGTRATTVTITDAQASAQVPASATTGPVAVFDWEGTSSNTLQFTVGMPSGPAPTVTSIDPNTGANTGAVSVAVGGTNFQTASQVRLSRSGTSIEATGEATNGTTRIDCSVNLSGAQAGAWDIVVTNTDSQSGSLSGGFTVTGSSGGDTYEPNDTMGQAYGPLTPAVEYGSHIYTAYDVDFYKVAVPAGCTSLKSTVTSIPGSCDYDFEMYDQSGEYVTGSFNWYQADELIELQNPGPGTYYLCVYSYKGFSTTDTYLLKATMVVPPPAPSISSMSPSSGPVAGVVTLAGSNFRDSTNSSYVSFNGTRAKKYGSWSGTRIEVIVPDGATSGGVTVVTSAGTSNAVQFAVTAPEPPDPPDPPPGPTSCTWYLAEGSTAQGIETWILVQNPGNNDANVAVTYMTGEGVVAGPTFTLRPHTRKTLNVASTVGSTWGVSTMVTSDQPVVSERSMYGNGRRWGTNSIGATATAKTWYLAEGSTGGGGETWILVQNPTDIEANVEVTYMTGAGVVAGPTFTLRPHTRKTLNAAASVGQTWDVSTKVASDQPVVAERSMYGNSRTWGTNSIGVASPSPNWYLAEGSTGPGIRTWIMVQNPNAGDANVSITYMTGEGLVAGPRFTMRPNTRKTLNVASTVGTTWSVSTMVTADQPVVAERSMYGNADGTNSIGATSPATTWYLAEGSTAQGIETWILVQNPGNSNATVSVTYMTEEGMVAGPTFTMGPYTRRTLNVASTVALTWGVSTVLTSDQPVVAEHSLYGNGRTWATNSIGYAPR